MEDKIYTVQEIELFLNSLNAMKGLYIKNIDTRNIAKFFEKSQTIISQLLANKTSIYPQGNVIQCIENEFTWRDIYNQFMLRTRIHPHKVKDYRPCVDMFDVPNIPESIVVWLKDGGRIIYTYDKSEGPHSTEYPL